MEFLYERTALLIGESGIKKLQEAKVAVFGIGGVGSYAAEALARAGVGHLVFIDDDIVTETNMNRQLVADYTTIGQYKVDVMEERVKRVNSSCVVQALVAKYTPSAIDFVSNLQVNYIIDAIDDISAKIALAVSCYEQGIVEIASMGTGNRLYPELLNITDIYKTSSCGLARKMRKELKETCVKRLTVVCSTETPLKSLGNNKILGSISFVPPVAGMMMAGYIIRTILGESIVR